MDVISKSQLKARMLEVLREVERSGEDVIVTDRGRPTLRIGVLGGGRSVEEAFRGLQGRVVYHEDPNTPTTDEWPEV